MPAPSLAPGYGDLPPDAAQDVEWSQRLGPASSFTVPLSAGGKVFGALAFATLTRGHEWQQWELKQLKLVAQVIANAFGRRSDTGPGIAPEVMGQVFAPFKTSRPGGMGMGLAICLRVVQSHGGSIRATDREGGGAEFEVTLPAAPTFP